jgi:type VI secretion system protein ImpF
MAELTTQEKLQPALLDRLCDNEPTKSAESREARVMSRQQMRAAVLRDLAWLFNATQPLAPDAHAGLEHVKGSVINFGLPSLSGTTVTSVDFGALEQQIRRAILDFEPRIMAETLRVQTVSVDSLLDQHNTLSLQISGNMWAQPVPFELLLRTEVDLETGQVQLQDLTR